MGVATLIVLGTFTTSNVLAKTFGTAHRGAWSHETLQIHYSGGVFFYPHYATHTHAGYAKYMRGGKTITSNWTGYLPSPAYFPASDKEEATVSCWDSLGWNDPKTIFHYSFE